MNVSKSALKGSLVGVVASTVVLLSVYEGKVLFANEGGQLSLQPGDTAKAERKKPPTYMNTIKDEQIVTPLHKKDSLRKENKALQKKAETLERLIQNTQEELLENVSAENRFFLEERDASWASKQEERFQNRFTRYAGIPEESFDFECHQTCCRLILNEETLEEGTLMRVNKDIQSIVGLGDLAEDQQAGPKISSPRTFCFTPEREESMSSFPDRGEEREKLLDLLDKNEIKSCLGSFSGPLVVDLLLSLRKNGSIEFVQGEYQDTKLGDTERKVLPESMASCFQEKISLVANFSPGPWSFSIPLHFSISPDK